MIDKNKLCDIYLDGFERDSRKFAEWFIDNAKEEDIFTYSENDTLISAGYIFPKKAGLFNKDVILPYISGLSTKKEYRGKGKIAIIIECALKEMFARGYTYSLLNPFNDNYYKKYGFCDITFFKKETVIGGNDYQIRQVDKKDAKILCDIERAHTFTAQNHLIKDERDIIKLIESYEVDGVLCNVVYDNDVPIAFYFETRDNIEYYASVCPDIIGRVERLKGYEYENFFDGTKPYIQARIINVKKAILDYPFNPAVSGVYEFIISDSIIKENNTKITVEIKKGKSQLSREFANNSYALEATELCAQIFLGGGIFDKSNTFFKDKF